MTELLIALVAAACVAAALVWAKRKKSVPEPEQDVDSMIRRNAALAIATVKKELGVDVDFDAKSVTQVEEYLLAHRTGLNPQKRQQMVGMFGAFLGETVIAVCGGAWVKSDKRGWGVRTPGGITAYPFTKVAKLLDNGPFDSIVSFLAGIPTGSKSSQRNER